jgi:hypothetical protein
MEFWTERYGL